LLKGKELGDMLEEDRVKVAIEDGYKIADELLGDADKLNKFITALDNKIKNFPFEGAKLSYIPVLSTLLKDYIGKKYTDISKESIVIVLSGLIYFVSPVDIIPDSIKFLGYFDDAVIAATCWTMVEDDIKLYLKWQNINV